MPDGPQIPPDQPGTPQSSDATGPLRDQSNQLLSSIAALANATVQIHTAMLGLVDDFKKAFETTQKMSGGLKDVLNTTEKIKDVHRAIAEIDKRIGSGLTTQKVTYKEVVSDVEELLALTQRLAKESPSAAAALNRHIKILEDTLKSAKKEAGQYGDGLSVANDKMKNFQTTVAGVIKDVDRLNMSFDPKRISGFEAHVRNMNASLRQMGSASRVMEKLEAHFDTRRAVQKLRQASSDQRDMQMASFHAHRVRHALRAGTDVPEMGDDLTSDELGRILASRKERGLNARLGNMLQRRMAGEEAAGGGFGGRGGSAAAVGSADAASAAAAAATVPFRGSA